MEKLVLSPWEMVASAQCSTILWIFSNDTLTRAFGTLSGIAIISFILGSEFSFLSACTTDSLCTYLGIQLDIGFLYFGSGLVRSLLRHLALLSTHGLAVPDMLILYHTFMNLSRARSALEGRLRASDWCKLSRAISPYYLPPNTAAVCCSVQRRGAGS